MAGTVLEHVTEAKYLGVLISDDLEWSQHIDHVTTKSNSVLGLLRRNISMCPIKLREQAYVALIRSRLEYCAPVWDPHYAKDINNLERTQRRAARFVSQQYDPRASVTDILNDLKWPPLKDRRRDLRLALMFKIVQGKVAIRADDYFTPADTRTRRSHNFKFRTIRSHTEQHRHSFFVRTIPDWNNLPETVVTADTTATFLSRLRATP